MSQLTLYNAQAKVRRGLCPSPSPSNGEGGPAYRQAGRTPGKSRLGRSLALPVGRSSRSTHSISDQIKPNQTKSKPDVNQDKSPALTDRRYSRSHSRH